MGGKDFIRRSHGRHGKN